MEMKNFTTLSDLKVGESGKVAKLVVEGKLRHRLFDMGLTVGTEVYLAAIAPLGDPLNVVLRGYHLTLRKEDAKNIIMQKSTEEGIEGEIAEVSEKQVDEIKEVRLDDENLSANNNKEKTKDAKTKSVGEIKVEEQPKKAEVTQTKNNKKKAETKEKKNA